MSFVRTKFNLNLNFLSSLLLFKLPVDKSDKQHKIHDYTRLVQGKDYVFELLDEGITGQMTGVGKGIKPCDYIILQHGCEIERYQVEEIDYYSDPPDMWIALLQKNC
ncbi:MAG: hypothetical protein KME59_25270 [Trichormus sp. ATA11-4-KO1]|jgi:MioC protein|nr:hypothetical protein [Trichormus sp. ATA11-4-KO1]